MAGESSAGYHQHQSEQQGMLFKSGGSMSNSSSGSGGYELISMGNYYGNPGLNLGLNDGAPGGIQIFSSCSPQSNALVSSSALLLDSVPGLKHDTGLAVEWSVEEQYKLEEGLAKYANEPNIMRYIKIAASLHDKTVRDVALRCRWMSRKRRKQEDQSLLKKVKDRKDNLESSLKNISASSVNASAYSLFMNHHDQSGFMFPGALSCAARHLLEENNQAFGQISANLSTLKGHSIPIWREYILIIFIMLMHCLLCFIKHAVYSHWSLLNFGAAFSTIDDYGFLICIIHGLACLIGPSDIRHGYWHVLS